MPIYYFDIEHPQGYVEDDVGQSLGNRAAARQEAARVLPLLAYGGLPCTEDYTLRVTVRNQKRQAVMVVTMDLKTCSVA